MEDSVLSAAVTSYPEVSALVVLIIGVGAGSMLRRVVGYGLQTLDTRLSRYATSSAAIISPGLISFARGVSLWAVIAFAVIIALRLLGVDDPSLGLEGVAAFMPRLLAGLVIIGAGHLLGLLSRSLFARLAGSTHMDSLGPRLAHWTIMIIAVVMGLEQMYVDITFITQLLLVLVAVISAGLMLALALGARQQIANVLARASVQRYAIGERIRIGAIEGRISEIHHTGVELVTPEGSVSIPAARFAHTHVHRLTGSTDDG